MKWKLIFLEILIFQQILSEIVQTEDGKIEGTVLQTRFVTNFYAFRRVPFAQPPIDELRFKAPLPVKPWNDVLNCTAYGPVCWQPDRLPASEDCLHLNVFSKNLPTNSNTTLKPVIAFLHSGSFQSGSPMDYGPDYLLDRDIVLVTINYRLGAFGFLALETEDIPGNAGMKDQTLALHWIKRNIKFFGGDPEKVTLSGITSTAYAIAGHMVSQMSEGLFARAIIMSGGLDNNLELKKNNIDMARGIAEKLNCSTSSVAEIASCFKSNSAADIVNNLPPQYFRCFLPFWRPVIEKDFGHARFLTDDIETLIRQGNFTKINVLTGTADEYFSSAVELSASWEEWWTYDGISGPGFWCLINPQWNMCNKGRRQSPINVEPDKLLFDPYLRPLHIDKHKVSGILHNTGQSLVFRVDKDTKQHVNISGGPLAYRYQFEEIYIHYGTENSQGSEHHIQGYSFPGEIQLYGFNKELYHNMSEAQHKSQGIVGISLMVQIGDTPNPELRIITSTFNKVLFRGSSTPIRHISLRSLLPNTDAFMTYEGSTTHPGCWESTVWIILNKPIYITKQELYALRRLMQGSEQTPKAPLGNNARPLQPLHHRTVRTNIDFQNAKNQNCPSMYKDMYYRANKWTVDATMSMRGRERGLPEIDTMFNPIHKK